MTDQTQAAEPVEAIPREWRQALHKLAFMASTSGGTAGSDKGLQDAIKQATDLLSKPYLYTTPPAAAPAPAVPQGWKLVPVEPTLQMLRSGHDSISCVGSCGEASPPEVSDFSDVWSAMLAATPAAPSQEPVTLMDEPDLTSTVINDACWKFIDAMPHPIPTPIWNDLKPAIYAALLYYRRSIIAALREKEGRA